jgi:SNF2 family DNA or RNA helicase
MSYKFKTEPYEHQQEVFDASWKKQNYALFLEMGTGKTKVTIDSMGALFKENLLNAALVIAPKGVYGNWVTKEIPLHLPDDIEREVVLWQPNLTKKFKEELSSVAYGGNEDVLRILVMNVEALSTSKGSQVATKFLKINPNSMCVVDESTTIKNRKAARTKNVIKAAQYARYRRILTGSPITKNPMDLYSQCEFLDDQLLGFKSFYAFQGRYAVIQTRTMGNRSFQHIVGYRRLEELHEKLDEFSHRILKEDCLDLPEKIYTSRAVPFTPEQKKAYEQMSEYAVALLNKGELSTTANVLTQIMRLQEICCGHLRTDDGEIQALPHNRLNEMHNTIDEMIGKVIIWASFVYDIKAIEKSLADAYGPGSVVTFYGDTPQDERDEIVSLFQEPDSELRFFVANPRTGGYGLTLTAATNVIYYNNSYDLEIRLQSEDRAHRIGQGDHVLYVDLISPGSVDEKILKALKNKISIAGQVLGEETKDWLL